jgi:hypothetical protein
MRRLRVGFGTLAILALTLVPVDAADVRGLVVGRFTNTYTESSVDSTIQVALAGQFGFAGQTWTGVVSGTMIRDNATDSYFPFTLSGTKPPPARSITMDCTWLGYRTRSVGQLYDAGFVFSVSCDGQISGSGSQVRRMDWRINSKFDPDPLSLCSDESDIPCSRGGVIVGTYRFV